MDPLASGQFWAECKLLSIFWSNVAGVHRNVGATVGPTRPARKGQGGRAPSFLTGSPSLSERVQSFQVVLVLEVHFNVVLMKYIHHL